MPNANCHLDAATIPVPPAEPLDFRLSPGQFLVSLNQAIGALYRRTHRGSSQVIIRFKNGYGAIISKYGLLEAVFEIVPLRFHGPT